MAAGGETAHARRFHARVLASDSFADLARAIAATSSDPEGVGIMTRKARVFPVAIRHVPLKAAPLLKQELLAVGGDAAQARGIADHSVAESDVVLMATWGQYQRLLPKLRRQPFQLRALADAIDAGLRHYVAKAPRRVSGLHRAFEVGGRTLVMGVVNVTPDSFSDGGRFLSPEAAVAHARTLVAEGADLLDIGGESTRPGAAPVDPEEEFRRIRPVLEALDADRSVPLSVDTRHAEVARRAFGAGADLVNDVSGLADPAMAPLLGETGAPVIVMHMRGDPTTMASLAHYTDLRAEVFEELTRSVRRAEAAGVAADRILIDPGLGFAKTGPQSLELLAHVGELRSLGYPVVVGASRKSFLGAALGGVPVGERVEASVAAAVLAARAGAHIVRVHDVAATARALAVVEAVRATEAPRGSPAGADWEGPGE